MCLVTILDNTKYEKKKNLHCIFQGDRIESLARAARAFITTYLQNGSAVGIVHFNTDAVTAAEVMQVNSQADKDVLLAAVPTQVTGSTSIGDGLLECQQVSLDVFG